MGTLQYCSEKRYVAIRVPCLFNLAPEMFLQMEKFQEPVSSIAEMTVVSLLPHFQLALVLRMHVII